MGTSSVMLVQGITISFSTATMAAVSEFDASPAPAVTQLECLSREVTVQGGSSSEIDVTTLCSTAKEFRLGLEDTGSMNITGHWLQSDPAHISIKNAAADKLARGIEVTFSDNTTYRCLAFVQQRSWSAAVDGVVTATYTFRLTGAATETTV